MTVETFRGENENYDKFPIGLRVLAVDDDLTCLKLLETLLRKCQYNVTTTNQARKALTMLREDKERFDLVISDVHMPDMDGFKLLEHVGLEMDLPVIMLSANGDLKLVMKGVTHGACDYLVKPVRLEELKNIWQHVIRKKKIDPKKKSKSANQVQARHGNGEVQEPATKGNTNAEQNGRLNRKRKDEEEESEDEGNDSEDPTTQKKPRVVWSIELHRKFVAAVNQLGIEKAVPKRILDMMNVEGLTRENVASHLQKYRLYLKRISTVANHQVNMAAALGFKDTFMRAGSYDGFGDFRTLAGTGRIGNATLSPYNTPTTGMLGRLNSPSNMNLCNISPLIQTGPAHNSNNSLNALGKVHPVSGQNSSLFQGIPSSLELDQLQSKGSMGISGFDDSRMFTSGNLVGGSATGSSSNLLNNVPNNPMTLSQLGNMSSQNMASFNSEPNGSSNLSDPGLLESYKGHSSPLVSTRAFNGQLPLNNARENSSSNAHFMPNLASLPLEDSRGMMSHEGLINEVNQRWGDNGQTYGHGLNNNVFGSLTSHSPGSGILSPSNQSSVQSNGFYSQNMPQISVNCRSTCGASTLIQQNDAAKLATEPRAWSNENFVLEQPELQGGFVPQSYNLDILMNSVIKREQDGGLPNCNFGFDDYTFGSGL